MRKLISVSKVLYCVAIFLFLNTPQKSQAKEISGWLERACIVPENQIFRAKLDTGAKTSSINAQNIEFFERDKQDWVRFTLTDRREHTRIYERPVAKRVKIKRHFGQTQDRPVVLFTIKLGSLEKVTEVNLVDRTGFNYQFLIGRTFLGEDYLIDPGDIFKLNTHCDPETPVQPLKKKSKASVDKKYRTSDRLEANKSIFS